MSAERAPGPPVDDAVQERLEAALDGHVRQVIEAHGGGVEVSASETGEVRVRFMGRCGSCPSAPVTMATVVRPALMAVEGVSAVTRAGRTSRFAEERIAKMFA